MSEQWTDHAPTPWAVDDNRPGHEGLVTIFDADGHAILSTGDMEDCEWRDICDAHFITEAVNENAALRERVRVLENELRVAVLWIEQIESYEIFDPSAPTKYELLPQLRAALAGDGER